MQKPVRLHRQFAVIAPSLYLAVCLSRGELDRKSKENSGNSIFRSQHKIFRLIPYDFNLISTPLWICFKNTIVCNPVQSTPLHPPLPNINQELLQRIAAGDESAFKVLILQYTPSIASVIYTITRSKEQTEDIVQDIFLQLWTVRETLTSIENINGFLFVLAKRQAISAIRKKIRERNRVQTFVTKQEQETTEPNKEIYISLIDEAVDQLPAQQQKAWRLSRHEGRKYEEIAIEMNISRETVKSYIQLANAAIIKYVKPRIHLILLALFSRL